MSPKANIAICSVLKAFAKVELLNFENGIV